MLMSSTKFLPIFFSLCIVDVIISVKFFLTSACIQLIKQIQIKDLLCGRMDSIPILPSLQVLFLNLTHICVYM